MQPTCKNPPVLGLVFLVSFLKLDKKRRGGSLSLGLSAQGQT